MVGIKAIETHYKGYRFRSRLKARWAVFFDYQRDMVLRSSKCADAPLYDWWYEHEGFNLRSGPYLPDFYFPNLNCFVEIKGCAPTDADLAKADELADMTGEAVFVFSGLPNEKPGWLFCWDVGESAGSRCMSVSPFWLWEYDGGMSNEGDPYFLGFFIYDNPTTDNEIFLLQDFTYRNVVTHPCRDAVFEPEWALKNCSATIAARSARFEHGESG